MPKNKEVDKTTLYQQNEGKEYFNSIKLRGTIVRKYRNGNNWLVIGLATSSESGKKDYPSVFWYGNNMDIVDKAYNVYDHVEIDAKLITSKIHKSQSIIGLDINDAKRELETKMGIQGVGRYEEDLNEVLLKGDFMKIFTPKNAKEKFCIATMHMLIDGKTYYPQFTLFGRQYEKALKLQKGTPICVVGHIQTHKYQDKKGDPIYIESVVGHYITQEEDE